MPAQVLLVEDNADDELLTMRALRSCGLGDEVSVARDGLEALEILFEEEAGAPGLVLLDLKLPEISGLEVLKQIRAHPKTRTTPVVVLTSSDDQGDLAASYRLGANSYIRKNADPGKFRESIQRLADHWTELGESPQLLILS
jgi:two-component system, response regulator